MTELFSVYQFFPDGSHERVCEDVSAQEAIEAAHHYCTSVGARLGVVKRVVIIDEGDCINFEWTREDGVTYPRRQ